MKRFLPWPAIRSIVAMLAMGSIQASAAPSNYTMADFYRVQKIDVHMHLNREAPAFIQRVRADKFKVLSINVDYGDFGPLEEQQRVALALHKKYPQEVAFAATLSVNGFDAPDWADKTILNLDQALAEGAVAVKVWKNIGLELRGRDGHLVLVDDARLVPVFHHLAQRNVVVLGHQGEPKNAWLPVEQMTVKGDQAYFQSHPQYHLHRRPNMPGYMAQLAARNRLLKKIPNMAFVGLHLGSMEWSIDAVGQFLDEFPHAYVDVAARVSHLQHQSQRDREAVRSFLIRYQDRILYGTDMAVGVNQSDAEFLTELHGMWLQDWRYFSTAESCSVDGTGGVVRGLSLPRAVVDKLYRLNALKVFAGAWQNSGKARAPSSKLKSQPPAVRLNGVGSL